MNISSDAGTRREHPAIQAAAANGSRHAEHSPRAQWWARVLLAVLHVTLFVLGALLLLIGFLVSSSRRAVRRLSRRGRS